MNAHEHKNVKVEKTREAHKFRCYKAKEVDEVEKIN